MTTWFVTAMNTMPPFDITYRDVEAESPAEAMAISDFEADDYLAISARFKGEVHVNHNSTSTDESRAIGG